MPARYVTYSPAYTLVPTYECFNRCTYCNFRTDPGKSSWLSLADARATLEPLRSQGVIEILILSGEVHPGSARRAAWFERIYALCKLARELEFLPHTNVGPLSFAEMAQLKTVNVSMGLMVEQVTPRLLETVHQHAPSKVPETRLQQLAWAGELQIPFTTGLLLGIGETEDDRLRTLGAIAALHQQYHHIQEVILQPYSPGTRESWAEKPLAVRSLIETVALARQVLPRDVTLQIPPNLLPTFPDLLACLEAGASDLGGISPHDEVNPDYPHPIDTELAANLQSAGWTLVPRLPIYPHLDEWVDGSLKPLVADKRNLLKTLNPA